MNRFSRFIFTLLLLTFAGWLNLAAEEGGELTKDLIAKGEAQKAYSSLTATLKKRPNDAAATYWLGRACMATYRYNEAIKHFNRYIKLKRIKDSKHSIYTEVADAQRLEAILERTTQLTIIDSMIVDKASFLSAYHLPKDCGTIEWLSQFLGNAIESDAVLYLTQKEDRIIVPMANEKGNLSLYNSTKLLDKWTDATLLSKELDTPANQAYPYLLSDGITLYFASDGFDSMGGYDLYITRYNSANNSWLIPENMGMPFNSPYNDYLLVIDELNNIGWFATDRFQPKDRVVVYTFIPSTEKRLVETDDPDLKRGLAMISSIKNSWPEGYQPKAKVTQSDSQSDTQEAQRQEMCFYINDELCYRSMEDFESKEAQMLYQEYLSQQKRLTSILQQLDQKRALYATISADKQAALYKEIILLESDSERIANNGPEMLRKIRRIETNKILQTK